MQAHPAITQLLPREKHMTSHSPEHRNGDRCFQGCYRQPFPAEPGHAAHLRSDLAVILGGNSVRIGPTHEPGPKLTARRKVSKRGALLRLRSASTDVIDHVPSAD